jgi:hypothetical protein
MSQLEDLWVEKTVALLDEALQSQATGEAAKEMWVNLAARLDKHPFRVKKSVLSSLYDRLDLFSRRFGYTSKKRTGVASKQEEIESRINRLVRSIKKEREFLESRKAHLAQGVLTLPEGAQFESVEEWVSFMETEISDAENFIGSLTMRPVSRKRAVTR